MASSPYSYVRMRNLSVSSPKRKEAIVEKLMELMDSGELIQGKYVEAFESQVQSLSNVEYGVSCSSASSGLYLALKSLDLKPGDEVITTPLTWLVTASAIIQAGAKVVFVDVDEDYNLDPSEVEKAINRNTRAILAVHYYGRMAQIEALAELAAAHNVLLIEDAAQAFGVSRNGRMAGSYGDLGIYSFSPMKVIGGMGDAGMVVTKHEKYSQRMKILRHCGTINKEYCVSPESKHIMDEIHAAFLHTIVPDFQQIIERRREIARYYSRVLPKGVKCPNLGEDVEHSAYDFPIQISQRDRLNDFLNESGVESRIRHPLLVSEQAVHINSIKRPLPRATHLVRTTLCLPIHNNIRHQEIDTVAELCNLFFETSKG